MKASQAPMKIERFKTLDELRKHIKSSRPTLYFSSQTSTVIPYDRLAQLLNGQNVTLGDLSSLPKKMELLENGNLKVHGAVNWKEAREFLKQEGRNLKTYPTEELALVCAGVATSATGERCFSFGNLRSQVVSLKYLDCDGNTQELSRDKKLQIEGIDLAPYQAEFKPWEEFKNAPFPRLELETDLMIGTEGQLGVVVEVELETVKDDNVNHLFITLPKWEDDIKAHLEILQKIQNFRNDVILVEFIDSNGLSYLDKEQRPHENADVLFFEVKSDSFEHFYEEFILGLKLVTQDSIFEISAHKFHQLRAAVPRAVFEKNSQMGVIKMGTDVQVSIADFEKLINIYREFAKSGVAYNLFGHFGDAHLHFNFMPAPKDVSKCEEQFRELYQEVKKMGGSPFAEHGIGLIKQKYIKDFLGTVQLQTFKRLKQKFDPRNQFFAQGFMSLWNSKAKEQTPPSA